MLAFGIVVLWGDVGRSGSRVWNICEEGDESFLCSRTFWGTPCLVSALAWFYNGCCVGRLLYTGDYALSEKPRDPRELEWQERGNVDALGLSEPQRPERVRRAEAREELIRIHFRRDGMEDPVEQLRMIRYERRVLRLQRRIREAQERNQRIRSHVHRNEEQEEDQRLEEIMTRIHRDEIVHHMEEQQEEREEEELTDEQRMQIYAQWMEEWRKREDYIRGRDHFSSEPEFGNATEIP